MSLSPVTPSPHTISASRSTASWSSTSQEVSGLTIEQDVIKYQQDSAQGKPEIKQMPGVQKAGSAPSCAV